MDKPPPKVIALFYSPEHSQPFGFVKYDRAPAKPNQRIWYEVINSYERRKPTVAKSWEECSFMSKIATGVQNCLNEQSTGKTAPIFVKIINYKNV